MSIMKSDEKEHLPPLSDRDRDLLLDALDRLARPMLLSMQKAKKLHDKLIVSDGEKSESGH